ncbi:egg cell-secreted protein 1.4-like [Hibiscus syriacus]|uniref:Egg cell-secreted protein 1.4-like n=1 Tax=Hibiscus syriacus TaxID=106335 RepID=A0A6A2X6T0_HIBSY|nr:egg cell-secreted protein 1.4-like [Hibiscus syriacus]KAE8662825.1 egg cell-secreted protein 1.4-like [Hibiscus syriacus]
MAFRDLFHPLVLVSCLLASVAFARQLSIPGKPGHILAPRLDDNQGFAECWNALNELKSCTDEIILFLVDGHTDIDSECCRSIEIVTRNCWPTILTSLGFTYEESNILRGYCDASPGPGPATAAAAPTFTGSPVSPVPAV